MNLSPSIKEVLPARIKITMFILFSAGILSAILASSTGLDVRQSSLLSLCGLMILVVFAMGILAMTKWHNMKISANDQVQREFGLGLFTIAQVMFLIVVISLMAPE